MKLYTTTSLSLLTACLFSLPHSSAHAADILEKERLFDSEARTSLEESGVTLEATHIGEVLSVVSGGNKRGTRALDNLNVTATLDGEKLVDIKGLTAHLDFLNNNGGRPNNDLVGSIQGVSSIETNKATAKLYQAWVEQTLWEDKVSVLAGLYDIANDFNINDPAMLFVGAVTGTSAGISLSGLNGPPTFPVTSLGTRIKIEPTPELYVQAAYLDGVPGDLNNSAGTKIKWREEDGAFIIAEAGYIIGGEEQKGKIAIGGWTYTKDLPNVVDGRPDSKSQGVYFAGDYTFYEEPGTEDQGAAAFLHVDYADDDTNFIDYSWATGVTYTGAIPGRDQGQLGVAVNGAHVSDKARNAQIAAGTPTDKAEYMVEVTYMDYVAPWLAVQPVVQYVVNPGADPSKKDATVFGIRTTIAF